MTTSINASPRKIIHIDMDAFYASVEQRDFPELRGKPLVVGGDPSGRGVVAAASYEVRKFGVHSAMSCYEARKRCQKSFLLGHVLRFIAQLVAIFARLCTA
nr:hypothetical protein [Psychrobacter sp. JCM 18903]